MTIRRAIALLACLAAVPACWPGRCGGAIRAVLPLPGEGEEIATLARKPANLSLNLDTGARSNDEILAASQLSTRSVLLEGPAGMVPLNLEAIVNRSAHSCASAGTLRVTSNDALGPGDYRFIILMDQVKWPALNDDVTTWQGHPAIVRKYRVP